MSSSELQHGYQYRVSVLLQPRNEFMYAHFVNRFYTGDVGEESVEIGGYSLVDAIYKYKHQVHDLQGSVPRILATLLAGFIGCDSLQVAKPDIANMQLLKIGERASMMTEPTLLFYLDIPPRYANLLCLNLLQLLKFDSLLLPDSHWICAALVPCNAKQLMRAGVLKHGWEGTHLTAAKSSSFPI
jgi:hypothetical protein